MAIDPTGTFLYVAAPAPEGDLGCEGAPAEALYVERVDGDGSDRRLAVDPGLVDATGTALVAFSEIGEIALGPRCEGHGATVVTGTIAEDGTVTDPTELTVPDIELGRPVDGVIDLAFLHPGILVAATRTEDGAAGGRRLYEFPVGPSEVTDLGQDRVIQVEVSEGHLVTLTYDGELRVDGQPRATGLEVRSREVIELVEGATEGFVVTPDGRRLFAARPAADPSQPPTLVLQRLTR